MKTYQIINNDKIFRPGELVDSEFRYIQSYFPDVFFTGTKFLVQTDNRSQLTAFILRSRNIYTIEEWNV